MYNEHIIAGAERARRMRSTVGALLAVAAVALSPSAQAAGQQQGIVVVRDAETGQLRAPTAAELKALRTREAQLQPGQPRSGAMQRADGSTQVRLGDSGMVYSVMRRDASGNLVMECVTGSPAADAAVRNRKSAAKRGEEQRP